MQAKKQHEIAFANLADFLSAHKDEIVKDWLEATRSDPAIESSGKLTLPQLKNHLPNIIDEICLLLRDRDNRQLNEEIQNTARIHGMFRWRQGYQLDELIRELQTSCKIILSQYFPKFVQQYPNSAAAFKKDIKKIIHNLFNEMVI